MSWCGLERVPGDKHICSEQANIVLALDQGFAHVHAFTSRHQAKDWKTEELPPPMPTCLPPFTPPQRTTVGLSMRHAFVNPINMTGGTPDPWFRLLTEPPQQGQLICHSAGERDALVVRGATWRHTFAMQEDAETWLNGSNGEAVGTTHHPDNGPDTPPHKGRGLEELHDDYLQKDLSMGNSACICGLSHNDTRTIEPALCPPGLDAQECTQLLDRSLDVTSLPGVCRVDNYGKVSSGEELAALLLQQLDSTRKSKVGHDTLLQTKQAHAMGHIKSSEDLLKTAKNVHKAWDTVWPATKNHWRAFVHEWQHTQIYIDEHLCFGLLPHIIQCTYEHYYGLLSSAQELLHNSSGPIAWKGSGAKALIKHHGEKMRQSRSHASNYHSHVLTMHVCLRDAAWKLDYHHEAMCDPLWDKLQELETKVNLDESKSLTGTTTTWNHCSWCH